MRGSGRDERRNPVSERRSAVRERVLVLTAGREVLGDIAASLRGRFGGVAPIRAWASGMAASFPGRWQCHRRHPMPQGNACRSSQATIMKASGPGIAATIAAAPDQDTNRQRRARGGDHGQDHEHALGGQAKAGEDDERSNAEKSCEERLH